MRKLILAVMLLAFAVASAATSGQAAAANSTPAMNLFIAAGNPQRLLDSMDKIALATVKGTPIRTLVPPGMIKREAAKLKLPSIFENPDAKLSLMFSLSETSPLVWAVILENVDPKKLSADFRALGAGLAPKGSTLIITSDEIIPGGALRLTIQKDKGGRILITDDEQDNEALAANVPDARLSIPRGKLLAAQADGVSLLQANPNLAGRMRQFIDKNPGGFLLAESPSRSMPALHQSLSAALSDLVKRFSILPMDIDSLSLAIGVDDDMLDLDLVILPVPGSELANYASGNAENRASDSALVRAISSDALFFSSAPRAGRTILSEGVLTTAIAGNLAAAVSNDLTDDIAALRRDFAANQLTEEVEGYYVRDGKILRANYSRVKDGKEYANLLLRSAEIANRTLASLLEETKAPEGVQAELTATRENSGAVAIQRLRPLLRLPAGMPRPEEMDIIESFSILLAANRNTVITLLSPDLETEAMSAAIARLGKNVGNSLIDNKTAAMLFDRMNNHMQLYRSLFKPADIIRNFAVLREILPGELEVATSDDAFAAFGLGTHDSALTCNLSLPLATINAICVAVIEIQSAPFTPASKGAAPQKKPAPTSEEEDEDDW